MITDTDSSKEARTPPLKEFPTHYATELTRGVGRAEIILGDQVYILRITRAGKLILTK